jgi:hypothetical protein
MELTRRGKWREERHAFETYHPVPVNDGRGWVNFYWTGQILAMLGCALYDGGAECMEMGEGSCQSRMMVLDVLEMDSDVGVEAFVAVAVKSCYAIASSTISLHGSLSFRETLLQSQLCSLLCIYHG